MNTPKKRKPPLFNRVVWTLGILAGASLVVASLIGGIFYGWVLERCAFGIIMGTAFATLGPMMLIAHKESLDTQLP